MFKYLYIYISIYLAVFVLFQLTYRKAVKIFMTFDFVVVYNKTNEVM